MSLKIWNESAKLWKRYQRKGFVEAIPYQPGMDLSDVSVSLEDTPEVGGMIARNPSNHKDKWYINKSFFAVSYSQVGEDIE